MNWLIIGLGALLAVAGCSGDGSTMRDPTTTSTTAAPCEVDDGTAAELHRLITDDLPPGYGPAPDAAEDTGPTDLYRAAFFVGDPDEEVVLTRFRFRRGYQRLWYGPGGSGDLIVHVYEFCEARGAAEYLRHTRERLLSPAWGSAEIDIGRLPDPGVALLQEVDGDAESFLAILQVDGLFFVEIGAYGVLEREGLDALAARARGLSEAQLVELP